MFRRVLGVLMLGSCITCPTVAVAQERAPHTGSTAVGVEVGAFVPAANQLDNAPIVSALLEYYVTPRVSLRTDFGLTDPGFSRESADSLRQIPLRLDVNYNWEGGRCWRVLPAVEGQRPGVWPIRNQAWLQRRRRHRVFHWPDGVRQR
jgi:hypothetical protein